MPFPSLNIGIEEEYQVIDAESRELLGYVTQSMAREKMVVNERAANAELADLVREVSKAGKLPVPNFSAGGIATPADAALMMQLGAEGVFVGSGIFKSDDPAPRAKAIVEATTHFTDADILAKVSRGLGAPMTGIGMDQIDVTFADRGW